MPATYNKSLVSATMRRALRNSPGTQKFMRNAALAKLVSYKEDLIDDYVKSNVTQEILGGTDSENLSNSLGVGNLFSFIGFDSSDVNPAQRVPAYLRQNITLAIEGKYIDSERGTIINFPVIAPTEEDFDNDFPMPWEPGSWLFKISDGISGLGEYIYHRYFPNPPSRSTAGLQMPYEVREEEYKPKKYFRDMYQRFLKKMR